MSSTYKGSNLNSIESSTYIDDKAAIEKAIELSLKEGAATSVNETSSKLNVYQKDDVHMNDEMKCGHVDIEDCIDDLEYSTGEKRNERKSMDEDHFTVLIQEDVMRRVASWEDDDKGDITEREQNQVNKVNEEKYEENAEEIRVVNIVPLVFEKEEEEWLAIDRGKAGGRGNSYIQKSPVIKKRRAFGHSIMKQQERACKLTKKLDIAENGECK